MVNDLIIIGAGVAGMTASIYASRYKLNHLLFGEIPGGQGMLAHIVENYPGFVSIDGPELMAKFVEHVQHYGVEIRREKITGVKKDAGGFLVISDKDQYQTGVIILAMGAHSRALNVPGEEKFLGRGVSYCSTCDAPLFRDKKVAVVGGGDAAVTGALHLAAFAAKVYIIHRRGDYRAEPVWVERVRSEKKIEEILENEVKEIVGGGDPRIAAGEGEGGGGMDKVGGLILARPHQGKTTLAVDGVFIEIGQVPASVLVSELGVKIDEKGFILVNADMETNVPGVFAGGDLAVIKGAIPFRQFITSAADGARAAASAYRYLRRRPPAPDWSRQDPSNFKTPA